MLKVFVFILAILMLQNQANAIELTVQNALQDYQFQDFKDAKRKFEKLLVNSPDDVEIHYYLGLTYQQLGELEKAIQHLEITAKSDVAPVDIEKDLAELYLQAGHAAKAAPYYAKQYAAHKDDSVVAFKYASVLSAMGENSQAKAIYQRWAEAGPQGDNSRDEALYNLGAIYSDYTAYASAIDLFHQIPEDSAYYDNAKAYIDALEPAVKPVSLYLSEEYFYETNPDSANSSTLSGAGVTTTKIRGSAGHTVIGKIDTAKLEFDEHWRVGLGYLFYGTFYGKNFAKVDNFVGHFLNPVIHYQASPSLSVVLQGDLQRFNFAQQKLSNNYGGTLTVQQLIPAGTLSLALSGMKKTYNEAFDSAGSVVSLAYLNSTSFTSVLSGDFNSELGSVTASYTFAAERTDNNQTAVLHDKALDSRYLQHTLALADTIQLQEHLSIALNGSFARKDYRHVQTGQAFPSVTGKKIHVATSIVGVRARVTIPGLEAVALEIGAEYTRNESSATELSSLNKRYFVNLSGSY